MDCRTVLQVLGAFSAGGTVSLAGCTGDGNGGGSDAETIPGSDYPAVDEWMTETEVGGADDTYEGEILDLRDESNVTIDVGAEGNGGGLAFGPSTVAISAGTEVLWSGPVRAASTTLKPNRRVRPANPITSSILEKQSQGATTNTRTRSTIGRRVARQ